VIIGGPNGAGKTTFGQRLIPELFGLLDFVNADIIARGLSPVSPESVAYEAGEIMLRRLRMLGENRRDFGFETTLSARTYARWLRDWCASGYEFRLLFVSLDNPQLSIQRVAERVRRGGHFVPDETVKRRFKLGIKNFFELYKPLSDAWSVYDNTRVGEPKLVAFGGKNSEDVICDAEYWQRFSSGDLCK
jgi:predicted ABC-type ATPase